jgi:hypothetical protein
MTAERIFLLIGFFASFLNSWDRSDFATLYHNGPHQCSTSGDCVAILSEPFDKLRANGQGLNICYPAIPFVERLEP